MSILQRLPDSHLDIAILHPPCTKIANSGNRWYGQGQPRYHERLEALQWTEELWNLAKKKAKRVCMENPVGSLKLDVKPQYIQPYMFGHMEQKKTGLWLWNLPPLKETDNVYEEMMKLPRKERERVWYMSPGKDRGKERSRFFPGIAAAMVSQWA